MDTMLRQGDFARGPGGLPKAIGGREENIQRALIRLTVKKGSFALDPGLGSQLWRLRDVKRGQWEEQALLYAREALEDMPETEVLGVKAGYSYERQAILLEYRLAFGDTEETTEVEIGSQGVGR